MWIFCHEDAHQEPDCFWIEHELPDHSHVDPRNATTCILYATIISMPSLLSAASVTLIGLVTNALIKCRKIWIFITGIIYILAGICTFTCIILFITYVIQELEHKEEEKGDDGDPLFTRFYGFSLYVLFISFCCQELGGISLIYLSVSRFNQHWAEKDRRQEEHERQLNPSQSSFSLAQYPSFRNSHAVRPQESANHRDGPTYNSSTWNGRITQPQSSPPHPRSLSANVSPASMSRRFMTSMNPDLDVRSQDIYHGNHIDCSYDSHSYGMPFPLVPRSRDPSHQNKGDKSYLYQAMVPTTTARQVTFSADLASTRSAGDHTNITQPTTGRAPRFHRTNSSSSSSGRKVDWRMTPV
ncbi:hypothetical protein BV898_00032 [Hypsibius exemplaris]|uniref:Voltage-dependent calcium channel gamma-5 subunit n=1 Tax=Hypsibius exemplaris TaxID=2072580 RepID=A0A1W0XEI2_HYPEX|nr:hypothetical protein BV898_00032 [Hypsibius exemplaris]